MVLTLAVLAGCGGSTGKAAEPASVSVPAGCDNAVGQLATVPADDARGRLAGAQTYSLESCTRAEWAAAIIAHASPGTLAANLDELCAMPANTAAKACG